MEWTRSFALERRSLAGSTGGRRSVAPTHDRPPIAASRRAASPESMAAAARATPSRKRALVDHPERRGRVGQHVVAHRPRFAGEGAPDLLGTGLGPVNAETRRSLTSQSEILRTARLVADDARFDDQDAGRAVQRDLIEAVGAGHDRGEADLGRPRRTTAIRSARLSIRRADELINSATSSGYTRSQQKSRNPRNYRDPSLYTA